MSWGELRDLDEWRSRLALEGKVEVGLRRWLCLVLVAVNLPLGVAVTAAAFFAGAGVVPVVVGAAGLLVIVSCAPLLIQALRPGPVLVVTREGLTFPRLGLAAPWSSLLVAGVLRSRYNSWLRLHLTRPTLEAWVAGTRPAWRLRRLARAGVVQLPWPLAADPDHLAAWLTEESSRADR